MHPPAVFRRLSQFAHIFYVFFGMLFHKFNYISVFIDIKRTKIEVKYTIFIFNSKFKIQNQNQKSK